jgi:hypothetical protein
MECSSEQKNHRTTRQERESWRKSRKRGETQNKIGKEERRK